MSIEDYWRIDDLIKDKWGKNTYKFIDYCGLQPVRPLTHFGYFCTPQNSKTFASTGGDGVHFGLVELSGVDNRSAPIVMTVPMAEENNVVVAENLKEFFSIGYFVGWFALEQIVYDLDDTIAYFSMPDKELSEEQNRFLELLRSKLKIEHYPLSIERLNLLKDKYFDSLEINKGAE